MQAIEDIKSFKESLFVLISSTDDLQVHGLPWRLVDRHLIIKYRNRFYLENGQPYLVSPLDDPTAAGDAIDARSQHFWADDGESLVGVVRATSAPFEFDELAPTSMFSGTGLALHIELSRLIVSTSRNAKDISLRLLAATCIFGIDQGYSGLTAICRSAQARLFARLGMRVVSPMSFKIASRSYGEYWLMAGNWAQIADKTMSIFPLHSKL